MSGKYIRIPGTFAKTDFIRSFLQTIHTLILAPLSCPQHQTRHSHRLQTSLARLIYSAFHDAFSTFQKVHCVKSKLRLDHPAL
jgi:hypothetical protein